MSEFVSIVLLALLIEKITEGVRVQIAVTVSQWVWFAVTAALGILLCVLFAINIFELLGFCSETDFAAIVGQIITGVAIGCGSNFIHDLLDNINANKA
jgi:hypothetical protein